MDAAMDADGASGPVIPADVADAVRAAWEVRQTRKRIAAGTSGQGGGMRGAGAGAEGVEEGGPQDRGAVAADWMPGQRPVVPLRVFDLVRGAGAIPGGTGRPPAFAAPSLPSSSSSPSWGPGAADVSLADGERSGSISATASSFASLVRRWDGRYMGASLPSLDPLELSVTPTVRKGAVAVLTPFQRAMDEAIWVAFKSGDATLIVRALHSGADPNYRRTFSDSTTALMAAAHCGDEDLAAQLVRRWRAVAFFRDASGLTAADIALQKGHFRLSSILRDVARAQYDALAPYRSDGLGDGGDAEMGSAAWSGGSAGGKGAADEILDGDGAVYDIYMMVDEEMSRGPGIRGSEGAGASEGENGSGVRAEDLMAEEGEGSAPPAWPSLPSGAANGGRARPMDDLEALRVEIDEGSFAVAVAAGEAGMTEWDLLEWDENAAGRDDDHDSEDSNAEDAPGNDYPDEDEVYDSEGEEIDEDQEEAERDDM
jgi:hypothetical protein